MDLEAREGEDIGQWSLCVSEIRTGERLTTGETMGAGKRNKEVRLSRSQEPDRDEPSISQERDCARSHKGWSHRRTLSKGVTHLKWERKSRKRSLRMVLKKKKRSLKIPKHQTWKLGGDLGHSGICWGGQSIWRGDRHWQGERQMGSLLPKAR